MSLLSGYAWCTGKTGKVRSTWHRAEYIRECVSNKHWKSDFQSGQNMRYGEEFILDISCIFWEGKELNLTTAKFRKNKGGVPSSSQSSKTPGVMHSKEGLWCHHVMRHLTSSENVWSWSFEYTYCQMRSMSFQSFTMPCSIGYRIERRPLCSWANRKDNPAYLSATGTIHFWALRLQIHPRDLLIINSTEKHHISSVQGKDWTLITNISSREAFRKTKQGCFTQIWNKGCLQSTFHPNSFQANIQTPLKWYLCSTSLAMI